MKDFDFIIATVLLKLKSTIDGGRQTPIMSGYRPNHVFEYDNNGNFLNTYIGDIILHNTKSLNPGDENIATINFLPHDDIKTYLNKNIKWFIHEGNKIVGEAILLSKIRQSKLDKIN